MKKPKTPAPFTREQWLLAAVEVIRARASIPIPAVNVSCSWPGAGSPKKRSGECWPRKASAAGINEVFISPKLEDPVKVVQILVHELAHAVDDCVHGHKAGFVAIAKQLGCEGKPTQMVPPEAWAIEVADAIVARVGVFPHRRLDKAASGQKKQSTRMLRLECSDCGAVFRMARVHAERVSMCPCCAASVRLPGEDGGEDEGDDA